VMEDDRFYISSTNVDSKDCPHHFDGSIAFRNCSRHWVIEDFKFNDLPDANNLRLTPTSKHDFVGWGNSMDLMQSFIPKSPMPGDEMNQIIDVGANLGQEAFEFAKNGWKVIAFEPFPANAEAIRQESKKRDLEKMIEVREMAISDEAGEASFEWSSHHAVRGNQGAHLGAKIFKDGDSNTINVQVSTLNEQIEDQDPVILLKIDTQGFDFHVLRGGDKVLPKYIQVEWDRYSWRHTGDDSAIKALSWLDEKGYILFPASAKHNEHVDDFINRFPFEPHSWTNLLAVHVSEIKKIIRDRKTRSGRKLISVI